MYDRVRSVWHERLGIVLTNVPVNIEVDLLVTQGELMRAVREAAVAKRALLRTTVPFASRTKRPRPRIHRTSPSGRMMRYST